MNKDELKANLDLTRAKLASMTTQRDIALAAAECGEKRIVGMETELSKVKGELEDQRANSIEGWNTMEFQQDRAIKAEAELAALRGKVGEAVGWIKSAMDGKNNNERYRFAKEAHDLLRPLVAGNGKDGEG
jgi:hypothetical protein